MISPTPRRSYLDQAQYDALSGIAPIYSFDSTVAVAEWRSQLRAMAETCDRVDQAEQFIAAYEQRAAALADQMRARWAGASMACVAPAGSEAFYVAEQPVQINATLLGDLGLIPSAAVSPRGKTAARTCPSRNWISSPTPTSC